jgi:DNA-binding NtrC family response regulator
VLLGPVEAGRSPTLKAPILPTRAFSLLPSFAAASSALRSNDSRGVLALADRAMSQLKAFIVEDSPVIRENLVAALEEMAPIDVVGTADDESTAVSWLGRSENRCDLVVVDIFLKSGSGLGVLKAAAGASLPMKLVVLSNYATPDMRRKCLELGADRVFDKSNEIDALILYCCRLADGSTGTSEYNALS